MAQPKIGLTCDQVIDFALQLPDTQEAMSHDSMTVKRGEKGMIWTINPKAKKLEGRTPKNEDAAIFAVRVTWEAHDILLDAADSVFWKKPHYEGYPAVLVDSSDLTEESAKMMVQCAWEAAAHPVKYRRG